MIMPVHEKKGKDGNVVQLKAYRYAGGKQVYLGSKSIKKDTGPRQLAKIKIEFQEKHFGAGSATASPRKAGMPFKEWAEQYMATKIIAPKTRKGQESYLSNHVYPKIGHLPVNKIGPLDLKSMLATMATKIKESSQNLVMILVAEIFEAAREEGMITINHAKSKAIKRPRARTAEYIEEIWTAAQVMKIAELLPDRYKPVAWLGASFGTRPAETLALAVEDLAMLARRPQDRHVVISRQLQEVTKADHGLTFGKVFTGLKHGHAPRKVPMGARVAEQLAAYLAEFPPVETTLPWLDKAQGVTHQETVQLILTSDKGTPMSLSAVMRHWNAALDHEDLNLPHGRSDPNGPHMMRHYFGSKMLIKNPLAQVSAWLGHADTQVTHRHYVHQSSEHQADTSIMDDLWSDAVDHEPSSKPANTPFGG